MNSLRGKSAIVLVFVLVSAAVSTAEPPAPRTPYYGFNLLEKFDVRWSNGPFLESDFEMIRDLGFNFVRLPMDYRTWIASGDWTRFDEASLKQIDRAVEWGRKYGIHVCINFHRAPGYTVAQPPEPTSVWSDEATLRACALHWETFARRYKDVGPQDLSFNLFNEPHGVTAQRYLEVVRTLVAAIRKHDARRPIYVDGLDYGRTPIPVDFDPNLRIALHQYDPMSVSHYKAEWIEGSNAWPLPVWPINVVGAYLYGDQKKDFQTPMEIKGEFPAGTKVRLRVGTVSAFSRLSFETDTQKPVVREFSPGPGNGEWKTAVFQKQWQIWQNVYDLDWSVELTSGAKTLRWLNVAGDWLTVVEVGITLPGERGERVLRVTDTQWGGVQKPIDFDPRQSAQPFRSHVRNDAAWLSAELEKTLASIPAKTEVMVQEFGAYNQTPHPVVLAWASDQLALWKTKRLGWALWNFRGSFGILDSQRPDVDYERYRGHNLDRKLLEILKAARVAR